MSRKICEEDVGLLMKRICTDIGRSANRELRPVDLTLSQMRMLMCIADRREQGLRQRDLEERFGVSHPTVTGILKRLEAKGFICIEPDAHDRRMKRIRLSQAGDDYVRGAEENRKRMEETLLRGLSEQDRAELRRLLHLVYQNVRNEEESDAWCEEHCGANECKEGEKTHG